MKLIDADVLLKEIKSIDFAAEAKTMNVTYDNEMSGFFQGYMEGIIYFTTTAYDIDAVVERLEGELYKGMESLDPVLISFNFGIRKAIEIVKRGVANET